MKRSVTEARHAQVATDGLPRTVAESTYQRLRQDILWGRFAPGSPLRVFTIRPGIDPPRAFEMFATGDLAISAPEISLTAPVRFTFFLVP